MCIYLIKKMSGNSKFIEFTTEAFDEAVEIAKKESKNSCIIVYENKKEKLRFVNQQMLK